MLIRNTQKAISEAENIMRFWTKQSCSEYSLWQVVLEEFNWNNIKTKCTVKHKLKICRSFERNMNTVKGNFSYSNLQNLDLGNAWNYLINSLEFFSVWKPQRGDIVSSTKR